MKHLPLFCRSLLAAGLMCAAAVTNAADASSASAAIRHALMATFDKPEARLSVDPVVVVGPHAVAGWAQGERGGRALLYRHGAKWQIALCAGDALKETKLLKEAGLSARDAEAMAKSLAAAEAKLPAGLLAKFASFDGLVRMDANGQHPPQHGEHGGHGAHGAHDATQKQHPQ